MSHQKIPDDCSQCALNERSIEDFKEQCKRHHEELNAKFTRYDKVLFGNGEAGLVTKVANMQQTIPEMKDELKKASRVTTIVTVLAIFLQPILVALFIKHLIK